MSDTKTLVDAARVVEELDTLWRDQPPTRYDGTKQKQLRDSEHNQEPVGDNPYWDIVRRLPLDRWSSYNGHAVEVDAYIQRGPKAGYVISRHELTHTFAWAIPTPGDIAWIKSTLAGRDVVEIGAGTGYWASLLAQSGVDVAAFDKEPGGNSFCAEKQYHPVYEGGHECATRYPDRALMLCWPPYGGSVAADTLSAYAGDLLIYIGEGESGCTADDNFFALLDREWELVGNSPHHATFSGIHCYVEAYRRKAVAA